MEKETINVKVFKNDFPLTGDREIIQEVASYVDEKMNEIERNGHFGTNTTRIAIFAALQIASELFLERDNSVRNETRLEELAGFLNERLK